MNLAVDVGSDTPGMVLAWVLLMVVGRLIFDGARSLVKAVQELKNRGVED